MELDDHRFEHSPDEFDDTPWDEEFEEWEIPGDCDSDENFSALGSSSKEKAFSRSSSNGTPHQHYRHKTPVEAFVADWPDNKMASDRKAYADLRTEIVS